ncbi:hypothetical protein OESDEN_03831 [Oesophagostomum dentatum]|uniref:Uncharacterized protein n=1 Tax=Oesophagostomum dentatum TaxID=61180 RepID=A0A0B1TJF1_OESDE|nr:hypothetical protein OESDEN_03831 [Oesophagostomum dentatum]
MYLPMCSYLDDEVGGDDSEFTDTASGTGESRAGEDDDFDDVCMLRSRGANYASSVGDEDDFPDLCEDIDADAMRRAAAAASDNVVLSQVSPADHTSLPPSSRVEIARKPSETTSLRKDQHRYKPASAPQSRHVPDNRNGDRREDEARRRRHSTERSECRTRRSDRRPEKLRERIDRGNHVFNVHRTSTSKISEVVDVCRRDDAELISVKGPLAHGWCSVDDEQKPSTSLVLPKPAKVGDCEDARDTLTRHHLLDTAETESSLAKRTEEHTADLSTALRQGPSEPDLTSSSSRTKHGIPVQASSRKRDFGIRSSSKEHRSSPRRKTPEGRHEHHHHTNGTAVIHGSGTAGKIPSLLDMCIKEPKELQHGSAILTGLGSSTKMDDVNAQLQRRCVDTDKDVHKSRSLLDLDIPPPDRKMMRQYAIVLNSLELTRRPSYARSDKRNPEIPAKIPRLSSPRSAERYERSRQPRSYTRGIRKVSQ